MYDEAAETVDVSEAAVVKDPALKCEAYELFGKATMDIPCKTELPYLVMQVSGQKPPSKQHCEKAEKKEASHTNLSLCVRVWWHRRLRTWASSFHSQSQ